MDKIKNCCYVFGAVLFFSVTGLCLFLDAEEWNYKHVRATDKTIIVSSDWHRQALENSRHGRVRENQKMLIDLLSKKGVEVAKDEVCRLDLKTCKITIGKLKVSDLEGL